MNRELFFFGGSFSKNRQEKNWKPQSCPPSIVHRSTDFSSMGRLPSPNGSIDASGRRFRLKTAEFEGGFLHSGILVLWVVGSLHCIYDCVYVYIYICIHTHVLCTPKWQYTQYTDLHICHPINWQERYHVKTADKMRRTKLLFVLLF